MNKVVFSIILGLALIISAGQVWAVPGELLWGEEFEDYNLGAFEGQDPCWSFELVNNGINEEAIIGDVGGNQFLIMNVYAPSSGAGNIWYWATRGLSDVLATTSPQVAFEIDITPLFWPDRFLADKAWVGLEDGAGTSIVWLYLADYYNTYDFNRQDLGSPYWAPHGPTHYRIEIDFDADTAALYVAYSSTPRMTVALSADFDPSDIETLRLGTGVYFGNNRNGQVNYDNIKIIDNEELICPDGDVNGDCTVDLIDFSIIAEYWEIVGDLDPDDPNLHK